MELRVPRYDGCKRPDRRKALPRSRGDIRPRGPFSNATEERQPDLWLRAVPDIVVRYCPPLVSLPPEAERTPWTIISVILLFTAAP
jgi:hypothetical protein